MILSEEKLRLLDSNTLAEAEPSADRSRPLEWRRSLNYLRVEVSSFSVDHTYWVNESCTLTGKIPHPDDNSSTVKPTVKAALRSQLSVSAKISFDDISDNFYQIKELDKAEQLYSVSREDRARYLTLTIKEGEPKSEEWGVFSAGSYYGNAGFWDDQGNLNIDVTANKESISELVSAISEGNLEKVILNFVVSSFSYEVDDALREWDDSRDLLILGFSTPAALEAMVIRKNSAPSTPSIGDNLRDKLDEEQVEKTEPSGGFLVKDIVLDTSPLKSIKYALWALVGVLFLILLK
jgi:hypothetical protein